MITNTFGTGLKGPSLSGPITPASITTGALSATSVTNSALTSGRVPFATTGGLMTDSASLTFNPAAGTLFIGDGVSSLDASVKINGAAGQSRYVGMLTNGSLRWRINATSTAEGGSNTGSNFSVQAFDDTATLIDAPISIARVAGGAMTLTRPVSITSTTTSTSSSTGCLILSGGLGVADGKDIGFGTATGTKIGTGATQKIGLWGATPIAQKTGYGTPTGNVQTINFPGASATLLQTAQELAQLLLDLKAAGIIGA